MVLKILVVDDDNTVSNLLVEFLIKSGFKTQSAKSAEEAKDVFQKLSLVTERFLNLSIDYWGYVLRDEHVTMAVRRQKALVECYPNAPASKCFSRLARKVCQHQPATDSSSNIQFFWNQIVHNYEALPMEVVKS